MSKLKLKDTGRNLNIFFKTFFLNGLAFIYIYIYIYILVKLSKIFANNFLLLYAYQTISHFNVESTYKSL